MIEILNEEQLAVVKEQIERLKSGLDSLIADQLPTSQYRLIAEPLVDELHRLRLAVNSYERKRQV
jgi:hypothetical protein